MRIPLPRSPRARLLGIVFASVLTANSCGLGVTTTYDELPDLPQAAIMPALSSTGGAADVAADGVAPGELLDRVLQGPQRRVAAPSAEATAASTLTDYVLPATVPLVEQAVVLTPEQHRTGAAVIASHASDQVTHVASVGRVTGAHFAVGDIGHRVDVLAVDPFTFRSLTPEVTAQAPAVWERLIAGDVLVRHDIAASFGLELGATYPLRTEQGGEVLARIGAFASNGAPPFADVLVSWEVAEQLRDPNVDQVIIGVADGSDPEKVAAAIAREVGGDYEVRSAAEQQTATIVGGTTRFEPFTYTDFGDGMIGIDPAWVQRWIVRVDLPRVGAVRVHRLMAPQLLAAMQEIEALGLIDHFQPEFFGGGWVPRHIDWNPNKPLSNHAWGLAVDFNTVDNCLGCAPRMDPAIVAVFRKWGFKWGGDWARPDGMHFELQTLIVPSG